jgi:D-serine deaminase-like pyridoxal phosphate-dependent protein
MAMARHFADHGWTDITVAFPVNVRELPAIDELAGRIELGVLVDDAQVAERLGVALTHDVPVWIKVDVGYGRAGVRWDQAAVLEDVAAAIERAPRLSFAGLLTHSGHSYAVRGRQALLDLHRESLGRMQTARDALVAAGIDARACRLSIGDTPTASVVDDFAGVDELRPGNFVFYDLMQVAIGACAPADIAVAVACPVVGRYAARRQIVIWGGAVHLGKESLVEEDGRAVYGYLMSGEDGGLGVPERAAPLVSLSQEHGIVELDDDRLGEIRIGDVVLVAPVHACLTCDLHRSYRTLDGRTLARVPRE